MHTLHRRFSVIAGFTVMIVLVIGAGILTRRQLAVQTENQDWVLHTRVVQYEASEVERLLLAAETGQRGYLYTGNPKYLAPYRAAATEIPSHIDALANLVADNPHQTPHIAELRHQSQSKLDELQRTIIDYQSGHADVARATVLSDQGLVIMNRLQAVLKAMQQEESRLEAQRMMRYRHSVWVTLVSLYTGTFLAVIGFIVLCVLVLREIATRERYSQEIRARAEWFRVTLTSIGDAVIATDAKGKVTFVNSVSEDLTGIRFADAVGQDILQVFPIFNELTRQPIENPVTRVLAFGVVAGLANHTVLRHRNGRLIPIEDSAAPIRDDDHTIIGVVLVFRDASKERESQEILRKTEKLAAAARMSATVAHEINNPLEAVVNLVFLAKSAPAAPKEVIDALTMAEQELDRVAHITRQTLGFYRESGQPQPLQVPELLESTLKLFSNKLRNRRITVESDYGTCPPVRGIAGELRQVFSNLISNATDAAGRGGTIRILVRCAPTERAALVEAVIQDSGSGIPDDLLDRVFEPFFTTKQDVGTGLGLWVAKEIIERHGGHIAVLPQEQGGRLTGAVFSVLLPSMATE